MDNIVCKLKGTFLKILDRTIFDFNNYIREISRHEKPLRVIREIIRMPLAAFCFIPNYRQAKNKMSFLPSLQNVAEKIGVWPIRGHRLGQLTSQDATARSRPSLFPFRALIRVLRGSFRIIIRQFIVTARQPTELDSARWE